MDARELLMVKMLQAVRTLRLMRLFNIQGSKRPFTEYFKGFENNRAIRKIFGERSEEILRNLKVEFTWIGGYMWTNNVDGHLMVSSRYLNRGNKVDIYLDVIHELVHVRQFMEGKELFDVNYSYAERPTEIEAYRVAVDEARNLGLSDERICNYLKTEWMTEEDLKRLAKTLNVKC